MIPIRLSNAHRKSSLHAGMICKYLQSYKRGTPLANIEAWLKTHLGADVDYKSVLLASPEQMDSWIAIITASAISFDDDFQELKKIYKRFRSPSSTPLFLDNGDKYDGFAFCNLIGISVCPYCNRNYIISLEESGIATCELDHFHNKDAYPLFALSFYNLIPACKPCNHIKSDNTGNYFNPHAKTRSADELLRFSFQITGANYLDQLDDIRLDYRYHPDFKDTFTDLKLAEVYEFHKIYVQDIIKKKQLYSEEYLEQLIISYGGTIFSSKEELLGLLLPGYVGEDKLGLRPFSKLSKDIWEQLSD